MKLEPVYLYNVFRYTILKQLQFPLKSEIFICKNMTSFFDCYIIILAFIMIGVNTVDTIYYY